MSFCNSRENVLSFSIVRQNASGFLAALSDYFLVKLKESIPNLVPHFPE